MIGTLITLLIMRTVPNLNTQQVLADVATKPLLTTTRSTLDPQKINFTIKNGTVHKLVCVKQIEGKTVTFLTLNQYETKDYENINENEYIGCNLGIDSSGSTFLTWFHVRSEAYTMLLEKVPCGDICKGVKERWATVVMTKKGEILPQTF
jgi:hypothetical protein